MNIVLNVRRKASTGEWVVRVHVDGKHTEGADYYTDDKGDAIATGWAMLSEYQSHGHNATLNEGDKS